MAVTPRHHKEEQKNEHVVKSREPSPNPPKSNQNTSRPASSISPSQPIISVNPVQQLKSSQPSIHGLVHLKSDVKRRESLIMKSMPSEIQRIDSY